MSRFTVPLDPYEIVSASALLPGLNSPSPSDLVRILNRIREGERLAEAARNERCRPRDVRRIARADPECFERHLAAALAGSGRDSTPRRRASEQGRAAA